MTHSRNHASTTPTLTLILCAMALGLVSMSSSAEAARPPIGKTYYTIMVGLASPYDVSTSWFELGARQVCSTDGDSCGCRKG